MITSNQLPFLVGEDREALLEAGADTNSVAPNEQGGEEIEESGHESREGGTKRDERQTREAYLKKGEALIRSLL